MSTILGREIEPFVDASVAAEFLVITRRRVLEMARSGEIPAHAIGERRRKMWRFRLSELADAFVAKSAVAKSGKQGIIDIGSPRQPNRRN